jgi:hypothetical protein
MSWNIFRKITGGKPERAEDPRPSTDETTFRSRDDKELEPEKIQVEIKRAPEIRKTTGGDDGS